MLLFTPCCNDDDGGTGDGDGDGGDGGNRRAGDRTSSSFSVLSCVRCSFNYGIFFLELGSIHRQGK